MKKSSLEDHGYHLFYIEIPPADYLSDIEIQDEYEDTSNEFQGLSEQQVSEIARDSMDAARDQSTPDQHPEQSNSEDDSEPN